MFRETAGLDVERWRKLSQHDPKEGTCTVPPRRPRFTCTAVSSCTFNISLKQCANFTEPSKNLEEQEREGWGVPECWRVPEHCQGAGPRERGPEVGGPEGGWGLALSTVFLNLKEVKTRDALRDADSFLNIPLTLSYPPKSLTHFI